MADNTKIWPIFRWANGGLSDDLFTGIKNSFYYSRGIEIREDAKSIYPKPNFRAYDIKLWLMSAVWDAKAIVEIWNAWYVFTDENVYKIDLSERTATKLMTWYSSGNIKDAELFNWYVYFSTSSTLYMISQSATDAEWGSSSNFTTMSLNTSDYHQLYATDTFLAVWNWGAVWKVTKEIPDQIQDWITLQSDYKVKFINELWWYLRITAQDKSYWAEIILWDKKWDAADEVIPMSWYNFKQSCIYNWYHYLLSDKWLWLMNWYQYYILKKEPELWANSPSANWMLVYDDKLYFCTADWVYIYWAKNKNYADVLNLREPRYDEYWWPQALWTNWRLLMFSERRKDSDNNTCTYVYSFDWYDTSLKWTEWEFQTMAYYWTSLSEIKQAMYLRVGCFIDSWHLIISYRTEADITGISTSQNRNNPDNRPWHQLADLTQNSDMRSPFATSIKLNCRFQWIQFKFELRQGSTVNRHTTNLYSADLYYNDMLD